MSAKLFTLSTLFGKCFQQFTGRKFKSYRVNSHEEFVDRVLNNPLPVIVNFHSKCCEPCNVLTPRLKKFFEDSPDIDLATIDILRNARLVHAFEVKAVPAVLSFNNGLIIDKFIGLIDDDTIQKMVAKLLTKK